MQATLRFVKIYVFVFLFVIYSARASCLTKAIQDLENHRWDQLTLSDVAQIRNIVLNSQMPANDVGKRAFEVFLEAQLRELPPEVASAVRRIEKNTVVEPKALFSGKYCNASETMCVQVPLPFSDSLVAYAIRAHEVAHAIQFQYAKIAVVRPTFWKRYFASYSTGFQQMENIFLSERQAMKAEWAFVNALPQESKIELLRRLKNYHLEGSELIQSWLQEGVESSEVHLTMQYNRGRYTRESIVRDFSRKYKNTSLGQIEFKDVAIAMTPVLGLTILCSSLKEIYKKNVCQNILKK